MGDLSLSEALSCWKDKTIWIGYPGSIYNLGPEATREHALSLLQDAGTGDRVAVAMSTENIVSNDNLRMLTAVLENAELPLTADKIDDIRRTLQDA